MRPRCSSWRERAVYRIGRGAACIGCLAVTSGAYAQEANTNGHFNARGHYFFGSAMKITNRLFPFERAFGVSLALDL